MRAAQGGHRDVCDLLLKALPGGVDPDEWADRMTALDISEAHSHASVSGLLRSHSAKRFLELPPSKQKANRVPVGRGWWKPKISLSPRSCECMKCAIEK
eukprot:Skav227435  [mRNA]  locus=scaffold203:206988:209317:+ [translate_table: standard]